MAEKTQLAPDAITIIWGLSNEFAENGDFIKAVACLEGLIAQGSKLMQPIVEAETLFRIGELLVEYTENVDEAKSRLERAQVLLASDHSPHAITIKHKASLLLVHLFLLQGNLTYAKTILKNSFDASSSSGQIQWAMTYVRHMTSLLLGEVRSENVMDPKYHEHFANVDSWLQAGCTLALTVNDKAAWAFFTLDRAQLCILQWAQEDTIARLNEVGQLLPHIKEDGESAQGKMLHLHFRHTLLSITHDTRVGHTKHAATQIPELQRLLTELQTAQKNKVDIGCTLDDVTIALANLISAACTRVPGTFTESLQYIERGIKVIEDRLKSRKAHKFEINALLRIKFLLHENAFYVRITQAKFTAAIEELKACCAVHQSPDLTADFSPIIHFMASLYAYTTSQFTVAMQHIQVAITKAASFSNQALFMLYMSLYCFQSGGYANARNIFNRCAQLKSSPQVAWRALATFIDAILSLQEGNILDSKGKLSECMALCSNNLNNNQFLIQVLNTLSSMFLNQMKTSGFINPQAAAQTKAMIDSAIQMANGSGDVISLVTSLKILQDMRGMFGPVVTEDPKTPSRMQYLAENEPVLASNIHIANTSYGAEFFFTVVE